MTRKHNAYFKESRKDARSGDHDFILTGRDRFTTGGNLDFNVPVQQPSERSTSGPEAKSGLIGANGRRVPLTSKFGNVKTDGFDSKREAKRYAELQLLERAGKISDLKRHPSFLLIPKQAGEHPARYIADSTYLENGVRIVEDVKGFKTPAYILKRKLMLFVHGIKVREV